MKDIVGVLDNYDQGSFCTGNADEWPLPEAEEGSDLRRVLDRGSFICAYNQDSVLTTQGGLLVLDTSDPNNPQGALVEWWAALITKVSDYYNRPLSSFFFFFFFLFFSFFSFFSFFLFFQPLITLTL